MIRFLFRALGLLLAAAGVVFFLNDYASTGGLENLHFTATGNFLYGLSPEILNVSQAAIQRHVAPFLWDPVLLTVLTWPLFAVTLVLGLVLLVLTARRRPAA